MEDRINNLKRVVKDLNAAGIRKTYIYEYVAQSLRSTGNESTQIRRAKAFAYLLNHVEQVVLPYEWITGSMLGMVPLYEGYIPSISEQEQIADQVIEEYLDKKRNDANFSETKQFEEGHIKSFDDDFSGRKTRWALMSRVFHDSNIEFNELQNQIDRCKKRYADCKDIDGYEIGRELERAFKIPYSKEDKRLYDELPFFIGNHINLNYSKSFEIGLEGLKKWIENCLLMADDEKKEFYQACKICIDAAIAFIQRYAQTVIQAIEIEEDEQRKLELDKMATILKKISLNPPETFHEALQLTWMLHIIASIQGGSALSFARIDQYLYPYYQKDIESGNLTREEAKELLSCIWIKMNEPKMRTVQSMTLGGITPDGKDAANDLTRLCLEISGELKYPYPNIGLRINKKNPKWLYTLAVETMKQGCGQPQLINDEIWIKNLMELGYSQELANDYYNMGCVEIMIPGKQANWGVTESIAFPILLENVWKKYEKQEITIDTFDQFMSAYFKELDQAIQGDYQEALEKQRNMINRCYDPFTSIFIDGCLESGKDMLQEGAECPTHWSVYAYGIGTVADSLCALKKHVYENQTFTLKEMLNMLKVNYEGYEAQRHFLEEESAHYGNGVEEVDVIADQILSYFSDKVFELNQNSPRHKYVSTLFGYFFHVYHGEVGLASSNGRKKGEVYSDSMGPSQGKDIKGPTRLMKSVLRLSTKHITGGYALNFKMSPSILNSSEGIEAMANLFQTYMEHGGPQIQGYTTSVEDIQDALVHPEKHTDLIVRVGGYCEFFVNLDRNLQKEIALRTLYEE